MSEDKLTACKDCEHEGEAEVDASCGKLKYKCNGAPPSRVWNAHEGVFETMFCENVNMDGHCEYFKAKEESA